MMLADIGNPKPLELARVFGVTERTVRRWNRDGQAPMPVLLAVFWLTHWGQSQAHCEAHNDAVLQAAVAASLRRDVQTLTDKLARLGQIGDFGAANDPAQGAALPPPPLRLATGPDATAAPGAPINRGTPVRQVNRRHVRTRERRESSR